MVRKYLISKLTATQNIGHLTLLVDCLTNFVVTQLMGLYLISLGVVRSFIYRVSGSIDGVSSESRRYSRFCRIIKDK